MRWKKKWSREKVGFSVAKNLSILFHKRKCKHFEMKEYLVYSCLVSEQLQIKSNFIFEKEKCRNLNCEMALGCISINSSFTTSKRIASVKRFLVRVFLPIWLLKSLSKQKSPRIVSTSIIYSFRSIHSKNVSVPVLAYKSMAKFSQKLYPTAQLKWYEERFPFGISSKDFAFVRQLNCRWNTNWESFITLEYSRWSSISIWPFIS